MRKPVILPLFAGLLMWAALTSCSSTKPLMNLMSGSFDSKAQATADSSYYNISLEMHPIWKGKKGDWLYVEQALATMPGKPYRVRVYKVEQLPDGRFKSAVYKLKDESKFIGKWNDPKYFDDFGEEILEAREGCAVYLKKVVKNEYSGSTDGDACKSTLRGASYATSKVTVTQGRIISWDQGWDVNGNQVWGAEKAGYIFDKK